MRDPDETDLEILRLLIENARRPYSEIAEHVGLSPPAVSDRIDRLEALGVIRGFTVDVDRRELHSRTPVLIELTVVPTAVEAVFDQLAALDATEHVFQQFDGGIVAHIAAPATDVHGWFREAVDLDAVTAYEITPLARSEWSPGLSPEAFTIACAVCGNTVTEDGETAQIGGEIKVFCCSSCRRQYEQRYDSLKDEPDASS